MTKLYSNIRDKLAFFKEDVVRGFPASIKQIKEIESILEAKFPESFKDFLQDFGYGGVGDANSILGIPDKDLSHSIVNVTLAEREINFYGFSKNVIPFFNLGNGDYYCFNTDLINNSGECPIYLTNHELLPPYKDRNWNKESEYFEKVNLNFVEWLEETLGL